MKMTLYIDGRVPVEIDWGKFEVGYSIFIPTLDASKTYHIVRKEVEPLGIKLVRRPRIENGRMGVRIWRIA